MNLLDIVVHNGNKGYCYKFSPKSCQRHLITHAELHTSPRAAATGAERGSIARRRSGAPRARGVTQTRAPNACSTVLDAHQRSRNV